MKITAYIIMRNKKVWDIRLDPSDYIIYNGKISDNMPSQYCSEIVPIEIRREG